MTELIQNIMNTVDKRTVQSNCKKIIKKCSFKSDKDLGNVTELAVWLYVYSYYEYAAAVCDILKDVKFTGNYTLWGNVDSALCLKARILREQGKANESAAIIRFINEYRNPDLYENLVKWFTETLDKNIYACLESNTKADAKSWRLLKLESAIKYKEGGKYG